MMRGAKPSPKPQPAGPVVLDPKQLEQVTVS